MKITREDAYKILGVKEESSSDEVRNSYKRLALKWHPDKHGDSNITKEEATNRFQEVSAAYKRLTTPTGDSDSDIEDGEFMNVREMMELFAHIFFHSNAFNKKNQTSQTKDNGKGVRGCPHHGMDCCDYDEEEYMYSDDDYYDYTDEESEDEFLDTIASRLRSKYEARKYMNPKESVQTQRRVTEEEALKNARELIEEEEREKFREEKKKAKRKKKKENKKQRDKEKKEAEEQKLKEKLDKMKEESIAKSAPDLQQRKENKENKNPSTSTPKDQTIPNGHVPIQKTNGHVPRDEKPPIETKNDPNKNGPPNINNNNKQNTNNNKSKNKSKSQPADKKTSGNTNKTESNKKKDHNATSEKKNKKSNNSKALESSSDEEIDTNSAFFAHAASKAPSFPVSLQNGNLYDSMNASIFTVADLSKKKNSGQSVQNSGHSGTNQSHTKKNKKLSVGNESHTSKPPDGHINSLVNGSVNSNNSISSGNSNNSSKTTPPMNYSAKLLSNTGMDSKNKKNMNSTAKSESSCDNSDIDQTILQSRQVAVRGNELAQIGNYHEAVKMFSKAIQLDPTDFRFFGNRSYCFDRIEQYTHALSDADAAIRLAPEWPKGYFRKGRALTGLKRFQEAEHVFQKVLQLDVNCEDAQFELARVRVQILIDMGFTQSLSEQAVRTYSTVQQALEALLAGKVSEADGDDDVYYSDDENEDDNTSEEKKTVNSKSPPPSPQYKRPIIVVTTQPTHKLPEPKCTAIWVGNVDPQIVSEKQMRLLFAKCGKVASVRLLPHKYCAFVNYMEPSSARTAMEKLQGYTVGNQKLLLKYPNNPPPGSVVPEASQHRPPTAKPIISSNIKTSPIKAKTLSDSSDERAHGPVNDNECYFWRTTGCTFENQCRYRHLKGQKGVDLPRVQAKYGKIQA